MNPKPRRRTRNDPRREATRVAIIEKAEELFARDGIEGVSLRQIGSAIGSSNTSVVAYHFGSKEALLEAIFHHRLPAIDARRQALLDEAEQCGEGDAPCALLRVFWLPLFEQVGGDGRHSYAGFISALMRSQWRHHRLFVSADYPCTNQLMARLSQLMSDDSRPLFAHRFSIVAMTVTAALSAIDRQGGESPPAQLAAKHIFDDTLRMITAALLAPAMEEVP